MAVQSTVNGLLTHAVIGGRGDGPCCSGCLEVVPDEEERERDGVYFNVSGRDRDGHCLVPSEQLCERSGRVRINL